MELELDVTGHAVIELRVERRAEPRAGQLRNFAVWFLREERDDTCGNNRDKQNNFEVGFHNGTVQR